MTGPTTCHLTGPCRPAAAARNARSPPNASWSRSSTTAASGSRRSTSTRTSPVLVDGDAARRRRARGRGSARRASARGSDGTAGRSGRSRARSPRQRRHRCGAGSPLPWPRPPAPWTCIAPPPPCAHRTVVRGCPTVASRCAVGQSARMDRTVLWVARVAWLPAAGHGGRRGEPRRVGHEHGGPHGRRRSGCGRCGPSAWSPPSSRRPPASRSCASSPPRPSLVAAVALRRAPGPRRRARRWSSGCGRRWSSSSAPASAGSSARARPTATRPATRCARPAPLVLGPLPAAVALHGGARSPAGRCCWPRGSGRPGAVVTLVAASPGRALPAASTCCRAASWSSCRPGCVVHDHLVLAETALFRWIEVRSVERALSGTTALDLTGGALGAAVEVALDELSRPIVRATGRPGSWSWWRRRPSSAAHAAGRARSAEAASRRAARR